MNHETPVHVPFAGPLHEARFVERPNRFLLRCRLPADPGGDTPGAVREPSPTSPTSGGGGGRCAPPSGGGAGAGRIVDVHMADPGRLKELLLPDRRVWLRWAASPTRRTDWSAVLVESPDGAGLVSVNTTMANRLIHRALEAGALEELGGWTLERAEVPVGRSRIDFLLTGDLERPGDRSGAGTGDRSGAGTGDRSGAGTGGRKLALEVKSVTLVEDGVALFPDAVTARGARHVRELAELAGTVDAEGTRWEAAILFVLQRDDAHSIEAARTIDPAFADALAAARAAGVRVLGRRCRVTPDRLELGAPVPVT
ncbi:MAG: DNA/RNA nuclease SfsA [Gemmatimonadota bacterium]